MLLLLLDGDSFGPFWKLDLSLPSGLQKNILKNQCILKSIFMI